MIKKALVLMIACVTIFAADKYELFVAAENPSHFQYLNVDVRYIQRSNVTQIVSYRTFGENRINLATNTFDGDVFVKYYNVYMNAFPRFVSWQQLKEWEKQGIVDFKMPYHEKNVKK